MLTNYTPTFQKLSKEVFILDTRQTLETAPTIDGFPVSLLDEHSFEIEFSKEQSLNSVFTQLSNLGIEVSSMRNKANRLEEMFVSLLAGNEEDAREKGQQGGSL